MTNTHTDSVAWIPANMRFGWLRSLSLPVFLFTVVLAFMLLLSSLLWLPRVTRIDVGGVARNTSELQKYRDQLTASITQTELARDEQVLPLHDALYTSAKEKKRAHPSLALMRDEIHRVASAISPEPDSVHIDAISYDSLPGTIILRGDVRNVGPSSMTTLATFADQLMGLPFVSAVSAPSFERLEDPNSGFHSPFNFSLTLR